MLPARRRRNHSTVWRWAERVVRRVLGANLVSINHVPRPQAGHDFLEALVAKGKTAFAAAQDTVSTGHFGADIPGTMHHDAAGLRIAVAGVQPGQADGTAMGADIIAIGAEGAGTGRVGALRVGETLQPAGMAR